MKRRRNQSATATVYHVLSLRQQHHVRPLRLYSQSACPCSLPMTVGACSGLLYIVIEYRTRNREVAGSTHTRSTASNLEQVANLLCAQANSASYPQRRQRDGKWVVATATRGEGLVWLIGVMVCLLAAPWVQLSVSSCHFLDCKALLVTSLTHVSGAIASVLTFSFTFYLLLISIKLNSCLVQ